MYKISIKAKIGNAFQFLKIIQRGWFRFGIGYLSIKCNLFHLFKYEKISKKFDVFLTRSSFI